MLRSISSFVFLAAFAALGAQGCHTPEPTSPVVGLTKPVDPPKTPYLGRLPPTIEIDLPYNMYVNSSVTSVCAGPDPFFKFDSSKANVGDQPTMHTLVNCMMSGPLRGKTIKLVGRTDPRGTEEYNERLGLERAEKIKHYMVTNGVESERILTSSLGKSDASPSPKDWAADRRVEILLVP